MNRSPTDEEILSEFGADAESQIDFARMVDRECSRSTKLMHLDDDDAKSYCDIMTNDHHSRSDIVRLAGVDNDVLTFWIREGLVRPVDSAVGRGKALRFDRSQVRIAKLLANGRSIGLNRDALKAIASVLQSAIADFSKANAPSSMLVAIIEEIESPGSLQDKIASTKRMMARHPSPALSKLVATYEQDGFEASLVQAASVFTKDDLETLWLCVQFFEAEGYLMAYWDIDCAVWRVERHATLDGNRLPAAACILLDLTPLTSFADIAA